MLNRICRAATLGAITFAMTAGSALAGQTYKIDASHSSVGFTVRHIVSRVPGNFGKFDGRIVYDEKSPGKSSVSATIQTASIDTGNERRDGHLRSADFFNAEQYPTITFASSKVVKKGANILHVTGDFTMHGVTRQTTFPVEVLGVGTHPMSKAAVAGFSAELVIKRSDFGVNNWTDAANILGDEVSVTLLIEAAGVTNANPCNPCGDKNACNPCSGKNPCAENPCSAKNPCNPCGE